MEAIWMPGHYRTSHNLIHHFLTNQPASGKKGNMTPQEALRHHVTGAIERGEKQAIVGLPAMEMAEPNYRKRESYLNKSTVRFIAERIHEANRKRDYSLATHLLKPYRPGSEERRLIEAELTVISAEIRAANTRIL
jgi:hypothetical protein